MCKHDREKYSIGENYDQKTAALANISHPRNVVGGRLEDDLAVPDERRGRQALGEGNTIP